MDPDYLRYESFENLYVNASLSWGLLCFNQAHQKQEVLDFTTDADKIIEHIEQGWEKHQGRNKTIMRAPEKVLLDLSEENINMTADANILLQYYSFLNETDLEKFIGEVKNSSKKFKGLKIVPLKNPSFISEVRIAGSDKRVEQFAQTAYRIFLKKFILKDIGKPINLMRKFYTLKPYVKDFYQLLCDKYRKLGYDLYKNPIVTRLPIWKNFKCYDLYVFIPKSSIKYSLDFLEQMGPSYIKKMIFWEYHTGNDTNKELVLFKKNIKNKKVLLIDSLFPVIHWLTWPRK